MQTAGAIVLSLFGGALFIVILGALATLIVLHVRLKKSQTEIGGQFQSAVAKIESLCGKLSTDVTNQIAGARTSFSGIRTDIQKSLSDHGNHVAEVLAKHEGAFNETVGKINGAALEAACVRSVKAANQIVGVAQFLQKMMAEGSEPAAEDRPAPEAYGPEDTVYARQSSVGALDDAIQELESAEVMETA